MHENRVYYTLDEAEGLLPRLEVLFAALARCQREANRLQGHARRHGVEIPALNEPGIATTHHPVRRELHRRMQALSREVSQVVSDIERMGVRVEDLEAGLVKIYSIHENCEIVLSWQYGEAGVWHWHLETEPAAARKPLNLLTEWRPPMECWN